MTLEQTAKNLLKKGIETGDEELISLANELLDALPPNPDTPPSKPKAVADESFIAPAKSDTRKSDNRIARTEKIDVSGKENTFVDDKSEHADVETPDFTPSPRRRKPFATTKAQCTRCKKDFSIHPVHKREHYICDSCIKR